MIVYTIVNIIITILVIIAVCFLAFRLFAVKQGDENIRLITKRHTPFVLQEATFGSIVLSCDVPFVNKGKQNGTIMDVFPRHLLPQEQFDQVHVESWTMNGAVDRHDGYWEAVIIESQKRGTVRLFVELRSTTGSIRQDIEGFPSMNIDIYYQTVGRTDYKIRKSRLTLTAEDVHAAVAQAMAQ